MAEPTLDESIAQAEAAPSVAPTRQAASAPKQRGDAPLAPGVIRHGMLVEKIVRDKFSAWAEAFDVNQGVMLAALVSVLDDPTIKQKVGHYCAQHANKSMVVNPAKQYKDAIAKVDPKALEAFLRAQKAL